MLGPLATTNLINVVMFVRVSVSCVVDDVKETPMTRKSAAQQSSSKKNRQSSFPFLEAMQAESTSLRFLLFNSLMIILQCEIKPSFDLVSSFFFFSSFTFTLLLYSVVIIILLSSSSSSSSSSLLFVHSSFFWCHNKHICRDSEERVLKPSVYEMVSCCQIHSFPLSI